MVNIFNIFSCTSVKCTIVVVYWYNYISYFMICTYVNFCLGFPTWTFRLNIKSGFKYFNLFYSALNDIDNYILGFETFCFHLFSNMENYACVYFNTGYLLYGLFLYKYTSWDIITSAKIFACWSIIIEGNFWYFATLVEYIVSAPLIWKIYFCKWCYINLGHLSELHHFTIWYNPFYMYLYL